jgi:hypothetical protein
MGEVRVKVWVVVAAVTGFAALCILSCLFGAAVSFGLMRSQVRVAEVRTAQLEAELAQARVAGAQITIQPAQRAEVEHPDAFEELTFPPATLTKGEIININFAGADKKGRAAIGETDADYWNRYHFPFAMHATLRDLKTVEGRVTGAALQTHTLTGEWGWTCPDPMWGTFSYSETDQGFLRFPNLPAGTYRLIVFAHGGGDPNPAQAWRSFSRTRVEAGGKDYGLQQTEASPDFLSLEWKKGIHYVEFEAVEVQAGGMLNIILDRGGENAKPCINGLQLERVR